MRLHIEHVTTYLYNTAVRFGRHRLVLRPREGHDLRVERLQLRLEPKHRLEWVRDVFGNSIALVDWLEPSDVLRIVSEVTVERLASFPTRELHEPWRVAFPPQYDPLEASIIAVYHALSFPDSAAPLGEWLRDFTPRADDAEGTLLLLCEAVHRTIRYERRLERGVQSAAETLALGSGSCRDMATLMMESARLLGVAARFASGYLHGTASEAGRASTHAWSEVYLPSLGWRGFDPTTGGATSLAHVVTGVSNHPRGVMPISGSYIGGSTDFRSLHVTVKTAVEPDATSPASLA
jgi:transglutaminase-like putative cysteine protease